MKIPFWNKDNKKENNGEKAKDKNAFFEKVLVNAEDIKLKDRNAWSEVSGSALGKSLKLGSIPLPAHMLYEILPNKINSGEIKFIDNDKYFYRRLLNGKWHTKMLIGNPISSNGLFETSPELANKLKELGKMYKEQDDKENKKK